MHALLKYKISRRELLLYSPCTVSAEVRPQSGVILQSYIPRPLNGFKETISRYIQDKN